jgi:hypothetical protein
MAKKKPKDSIPKLPLRCRVHKGVLSIEIGIDTLAWAYEHQPDNWTGEGDDAKYRVVDKKEFARDVASEMNREAEDGSTPLSLFFDAMCTAAADDGSIAVEPTDPATRREYGLDDEP